MVNHDLLSTASRRRNVDLILTWNQTANNCTADKNRSEYGESFHPGTLPNLTETRTPATP